MEFKGTKGPWVQNGNNGIHTKEGLCIAITNGQNKKANAKLISKAPEMLEMLERLKLMCDNLVMPTERDLNTYSIEISNLIKEATEL